MTDTTTAAPAPAPSAAAPTAPAPGSATSALAAPAPPASPRPAGTPPGPTPPATDSWQSKWLPEDLAGDETLARYPDIPSLAKGLLETRAWAKDRVTLPKAGDPASFREFAEKVRPESADKYDIPVPDGEDNGFAERMRPKFYELGLEPTQARQLVEAYNQEAADQLSRLRQASIDGVKAIELELGPTAYAQRNEAARMMLEGLGIEAAELMPALEQIAGSEKALRAMHILAERTGELAKVDGATVRMAMGNMNRDEAQAELTRMDGDATIRAEVQKPNSEAGRRRQALIDLIAKGEVDRR